jgi:hypothetical protein
MNFMPNRDYMRSQPHINAQMRHMLNDWLIQMHLEFSLKRETLFLTVNIADRYLSATVVLPQHLQLVGVAAMLVASKFEEVNPPEVKRLAYYTANAYTCEEIIKREAAILRTLGFEVASPTAAHFLVHFQMASPPLPGERGSPAAASRGDACSDLEWHLLEKALLEYCMVGYCPSKLAAAALMLSGELSGRRQAWPDALARISGHSRESLEPCVSELRELLAAGARR